MVLLSKILSIKTNKADPTNYLCIFWAILMQKMMFLGLEMFCHGMMTASFVETPGLQLCFFFSFWMNLFKYIKVDNAVSYVTVSSKQSPRLNNLRLSAGTVRSHWE